MFHYEMLAWDQGCRLVAGVDEAGVGPLAGPVVAAAVVMDPNHVIPGVNDSKMVPAGRRERLASLIRETALSYAIGLASVEEIDRLNIYNAGLLAMQRAVEQLNLQPDRVLVDARRIPSLEIPQQAIKQGDRLSYTIAAASILAKTNRDQIMMELDRLYPSFGFARHKGYPTAEHKKALREFGACPAHRRSFSAVYNRVGEHSELFSILRRRIREAHTTAEIRRLATILRESRRQLMTPEWRELREALEGRQTAIRHPLFAAPSP